MKNKLNPKDKGSTIIEIVVALVLLTIITFSAPNILPLLSKKTNTIPSYQDRFVVAIERYLALAAVVRNSARQTGFNDDLLYDCISTVVPGENDCDTNQVYPVELYGPFQDISGTGSSDGQITGTPDAPIRRTQNGFICTTNDQCVVEVETTFTPICPPAPNSLVPASKCDEADSIIINYTIRKLVPVVVVIQNSITHPVRAIQGR